MFTIKNITENKQEFTFVRNIFKDNNIQLANIIGTEEKKFIVEYLQDKISITDKNNNTHTKIIENDSEFTYKILKTKIKAKNGVLGLKSFLQDKFWESRITLIFNNILGQNVL